MATYQFSALADGQSISFSPTADRLNFDQSAIAAGDLRVGAVDSNVVVTHVSTGKQVTLLNIAPNQLAASNFTLTNASLALFGDNSPGTANDAGSNVLTGGTNGDDWLEGGFGVDRLAGGNGKDSFVFREAGTANADNVNDFVTNCIPTIAATDIAVI